MRLDPATCYINNILQVSRATTLVLTYGYHLLAGLLLQWVNGMHQGFQKFQASMLSNSPQLLSLVEQTCTYSQQAITASVECDQIPTASKQQRRLHTRPQMPITLPVSPHQQQPQQHQGLGASQFEGTSSEQSLPPVQALVESIMELTIAMTSAMSTMKAAVLLRLIKLAHSLIEAAQRQGVKVPSASVDAMMDTGAAMGKLR